MRGYIAKDKAGIIVGALISLAIVKWFVLLAIVSLLVR
jgi:hypothetical protein